MTKLRTPGTVTDALDRAVGLLTKGIVAETIGKSAALVDKMADPDDDSRHLSVRWAIAIDARLVKEGHDPVFAPLLADKVLEARPMKVIAEAPEPPMRHATRLVGEAADILAKVDRADDDGVGDAAEIAAIADAIKRLQATCAPLRKALAARERGGSGRSRK